MKKKNDDDDLSLFRQTLSGVKPVQQDKIAPKKKKPKPIPRQRRLDDSQVLNDLLSRSHDMSELETGEELVYLKAGVQQTVLRKLRRGHYSIGAELDLHGLTSLEAHREVSHFLQECRYQGIYCVRIIHGKGYGSKDKLPVLKNKLNNWLRQYDQVLAFSSARAFDGGTGAVYVLLKRG